VATIPLVPKQMDALIQGITLAMGLKLTTDPNPNNLDSPLNPKFIPGTPNYYGVRCGWQQQGQPFPNIDEDVVFVRALEIDDQYNRIRDVSYPSSTSGTPPVTTYTKVTNYTRVWETFFSVYGPNSFDNARKIRSRLFDQDIHDQFAVSQLYWITDPPAPRRVPEYENEQWWERVDFSARFNEFVTEIYPTQVIESAEIVVVNELNAPLFDFVINPGALLTEDDQPFELENGGSILLE
jgi:hypothetical protein